MWPGASRQHALERRRHRIGLGLPAACERARCEVLQKLPVGVLVVQRRKGECKSLFKAVQDDLRQSGNGGLLKATASMRWGPYRGLGPPDLMRCAN